MEAQLRHHLISHTGSREWKLAEDVGRTAYLVRHISHLVLAVDGPFCDLWRGGFSLLDFGLIGPGILCFLEAAFEDLSRPLLLVRGLELDRWSVGW